MNTIDRVELFTRLNATYGAQLAIGMVMFLAFRYCYKVYSHRFLKTWSLSWISFATCMLGMLFINLSIYYQRTIPSQTSLSLLSQIGGFLQVYFLMMGTWELINQRRLPQVPRRYLMAAVCAVATISVLVAMEGKELAYTRYALRYGLRTFLLGTAYSLAGYLVWTHQRFGHGFGQKLLSISFALFGMVQFTYVSIIILNIYGAQYSVPTYFGVVDLFVISLNGLSMVLWLLEEERAKLNKSNHELNSLLYRTSHDLRAPVASVLGLANVARLEVKDNQSLEYINKIEARTQKLDSVIKDIMLFAQNTKSELKFEKVDFNKLVDECVTEIDFTKDGKKITIEYARDVHNVLVTDARILKTVLVNLIENAIKYHRPQQECPAIQIIFKKNSYRVLIAVEDNGKGIESVHLDKIFDMFYRASEESDGTGLGLYIVREAITRMKGSIGVSSDVGFGSKFTITLPANIS